MTCFVYLYEERRPEDSLLNSVVHVTSHWFFFLSFLFSALPSSLMIWYLVRKTIGHFKTDNQFWMSSPIPHQKSYPEHLPIIIILAWLKSHFLHEAFQDNPKGCYTLRFNSSYFLFCPFLFLIVFSNLWIKLLSRTDVKNFVHHLLTK